MAAESTRHLLDKVASELSKFPEQEQEKLVSRFLTDLDSRDYAKKNAELRLALVFDQSPLAIVEWALDFVVIGWNPAAEALFGYSRDEAMGVRGDLLIVAPEARKDIAVIWEELKAHRTTMHNINHNMTKDGRIVTCEWHNVPLIDNDGNVV